MILKLATFNLRCQNDYDRARNRDFVARRASIAAQLRAAAPDAVGFQELLPGMRDWLESELGDYQFVGVEREAGFGGECNAIAFRKDAVRLHETYTFWLSPTPSVPGSRFEKQSTCPRVCTVTLLRQRPTGQLFRFLNTHLDHEQEFAMEEGLKLVFAAARREQEKQRLPLVITGDFNFTPASAPHRLIAENGYEDLAADSGGTFHNFGALDWPEKIDYILSDGSFRRLDLCAWHADGNGRCLSDHDGLMAQVEA